MTLEVTTTLELEGSTKNTHKYAEPADQVPVLSNLYLQKHQVDGMPPSEIEVTIEAVEKE